MITPKPRWLYRFDNYSRAFKLLREIVELMGERPLSQFEKEAMIKRFECTWELAWKLIKDYLDYSGIPLENSTPRTVIKEAFAANIIPNGDIFMKALDARNLMAHTYDFQAFEITITEIIKDYYPMLQGLYSDFLEKAVFHE